MSNFVLSNESTAVKLFNKNKFFLFSSEVGWFEVDSDEIYENEYEYLIVEPNDAVILTIPNDLYSTGTIFEYGFFESLSPATIAPQFSFDYYSDEPSPTNHAQSLEQDMNVFSELQNTLSKKYEKFTSNYQAFKANGTDLKETLKLVNHYINSLTTVITEIKHSKMIISQLQSSRADARKEAQEYRQKFEELSKNACDMKFFTSAADDLYQVMKISGPKIDKPEKISTFVDTIGMEFIRRENIEPELP